MSLAIDATMSFAASRCCAAWEAGDGDRTITDLGAVDPQALIKLYQDHSFMPSRTLDKIAPLLRADDDGAGPIASPHRRGPASPKPGGHSPRRRPHSAKP